MILTCDTCRSPIGSDTDNVTEVKHWGGLCAVCWQDSRRAHTAPGSRIVRPVSNHGDWPVTVDECETE
jgi:hypothetical protein